MYYSQTTNITFKYSSQLQRMCHWDLTGNMVYMWYCHFSSFHVFCV